MFIKFVIGLLFAATVQSIVLNNKKDNLTQVNTIQQLFQASKKEMQMIKALDLEFFKSKNNFESVYQ